MKQPKNIVIIILTILVIVLSIFIVFSKKDNDLNKKENIEENNNNEQTIIKTNQELEETEENNNTEQITNEIPETNSENNFTEQDLVDYFSNIENEVNNETNANIIKTKFKDYFTNTIDFIFYDKEIKGYKFKDLTSTAKLKIIASAIKIDSKIDEKIPNYKETLNAKYKDIKSELVMNYLDLTVSICSNHEQGCDKAKELFGEIKNKGKIGLSYIKNILSKGKNKLKDYYEIYKNS